MNAVESKALSEVGGRAVLDEAMRAARDDLEAGAEPRPRVVTKSWGDPEVESFSGGLEEARARMRELLGRGSGPGHCAMVHVSDPGDGTEAIVVEVGHMGGGEAEVFVQHFRPRRGLFRPFKLVGDVSRATGGELANRAGGSSGDGLNGGNGPRRT